jgi:hypothetical protein
MRGNAVSSRLTFIYDANPELTAVEGALVPHMRD